MWTVIGFKKADITFAMSNYPVAVATPSKCCRHFLCLIESSKYRKNGVVAIREVVTNPLIYSRWLGIGHTNGRSTVLFALNQYWLITYKCPIPMLHRNESLKQVQCQMSDQKHSVSSAIKNIYNDFGVAYPLDFILDLVESKISQCADQDMDEVMETLRVSRIIVKNLALALEEVATLHQLEIRRAKLIQANVDFESTMGIISSIKPSEN